MAFYDYSFVTHWKVRGPIRAVYAILKDGKNYSRWWRPAYLKSEEIAPNRVQSLVRAKLPYTLIFTTEPVRENPPHEFEIRASGELAGTGLWKLRQEGEWTYAEFHWNVRAEKPLVRWLSFLLKPIFKWNHDWVMKTGEACLSQLIKTETDRRHLP